MRGTKEAKRIWLAVLGAGDSTIRGEKLCRYRGLSRAAMREGLIQASYEQNEAMCEIKRARRILAA
jgi:hypothetical protein